MRTPLKVMLAIVVLAALVAAPASAAKTKTRVLTLTAGTSASKPLYIGGWCNRRSCPVRRSAR